MDMVYSTIACIGRMLTQLYQSKVIVLASYGSTDFKSMSAVMF